MGRPGGSLLVRLRRAFGPAALAAEADGALLRRYAAGGPDAAAAFEALVRRHGPLVWRACRAALRHGPDADDAFQATFLILLRKAGGLRAHGTLGPWLFEVARRVCARAKADAVRRRLREQQAPARSAGDGLDWDAAAAVHEEVGRLPASLRTAVVLCDLGGLSYAEAAARLGWTAATLRGRLARARARLRGRLARRGLGPVVVGVVAVPNEVVAATVGAAAGVVSPAVVGFVSGGLQAMFVAKCKAIGWAVVAAGALAAGAAGVGGPRAATAAADPHRLRYGDGTADGKKSLGGSGPMIQFKAPAGGAKLAGVRVHGSRYGTPQAPDERFLVYLLTGDGAEVVSTQLAPYALFERGAEAWVDVPFARPVAVPAEFRVALDFRAGPRKGVYVSYDTSTGGKHSRAGLPGLTATAVDFGGDWMVEAVPAK